MGQIGIAFASQFLLLLTGVNARKPSSQLPTGMGLQTCVETIFQHIDYTTESTAMCLELRLMLQVLV